MRDPQICLFLPLLARPHRHAPILQTKPVDTSTLSAHESELAPRAARAFFDEHKNWVGEEVYDQKSSELIHNLAACLRLVRPMRESSLLMQGGVRDDGTFDVQKFDHPL